MFKKKFIKSLYVYDENALSLFCDHFQECLANFPLHSFSDIVVACIGTDRSTGDCLGPLVGYKLNSYDLQGFHLFGTLVQPVHAMNLDHYVGQINSYQKPLVIAIDAALGDANCIGNIVIKNQGLHPGSGVNKKLTSLGDISVTAIVNSSGMFDVMTLQNTRLGLVMTMADIISLGLVLSLSRLEHQIVSRETISM